MRFEVRAPRPGHPGTLGAVNVLVEIEPPAARVTLNRPERRNALSLELLEELDAARSVA